MIDKTAFIIEYAALVRETPGETLLLLLPGGLVIGRPTYVRAYMDKHVRAQPPESFQAIAETGRENIPYIALEAATYQASDGTGLPLGDILIDPSTVAAWGRRPG